jgi:hypothetical protein
MDRAAAKWFGCKILVRTFAGLAMLSVTSATRVLVATAPVDLRGSFNRLYSLVGEQLKADPLSSTFVDGSGTVRPLGSGVFTVSKNVSKGVGEVLARGSGRVVLD